MMMLVCQAGADIGIGFQFPDGNLTSDLSKPWKTLTDFFGSNMPHKITISRKELNDPNLNICAGIRWLFEKRRLLSSRLKRSATWVETVWDYKAVKRAKTKEDAERIKKTFNKFYEELQKCGKP